MLTEQSMVNLNTADIGPLDIFLKKSIKNLD